MSVSRKLKQCRFLSVCYYISNYLCLASFVFSFPAKILENGTPAIFWVTGYVSFVCTLEQYLVKRVWSSRPKTFTLVVISAMGIFTFFLFVAVLWCLVYVAGGNMHQVRYLLKQNGEELDVTERLTLSVSLGFFFALFNLVTIILLFLLYQRLHYEWAKAVIWLKKQPSDDSINKIEFINAQQKKTYYNDQNKSILEGEYHSLL